MAISASSSVNCTAHTSHYNSASVSERSSSSQPGCAPPCLEIKVTSTRHSAFNGFGVVPYNGPSVDETSHALDGKLGYESLSCKHRSLSLVLLRFIHERASERERESSSTNLPRIKCKSESLTSTESIERFMIEAEVPASSAVRLSRTCCSRIIRFFQLGTKALSNAKLNPVEYVK